MRPARLLIAGLVGGAILLALSSPAETVRAERGKELFMRRCSGFHAPDINKRVRASVESTAAKRPVCPTSLIRTP